MGYKPDESSSPVEGSKPEEYAKPEENSSPVQETKPNEYAKPEEAAKPPAEPAKLEEYKEVDLMETDDENLGDRIIQEMMGVRTSIDSALKRIHDEIARSQKDQTRLGEKY